MSVVVTGAGGFIGQALTRCLTAAGVDAVPMTRADVDLADPGAVAALLADRRPRTIVHLAASLSRSESAEDAERQWRDTFTAGRIVLNAAIDAGTAHVVAAGSVAELGAAEGALGVDTPPSPATLYGLCKSLVREVASFVASRGPAMGVDWFRPFTVYGPGQVTGVVADACAAAASGRRSAFSDGRQRRDFVHVDDVADWITRTVCGHPPRPGFRIHHVGTGRAVPVGAVLDLVATEFPGARFDIGARPRRTGEPETQFAGAPITAAGDPWSAAISVENGIASTAAWWRARTAAEGGAGAQVDRPAGI